jgi:hypothetical protein
MKVWNFQGVLVEIVCRLLAAFALLLATPGANAESGDSICAGLYEVGRNTGNLDMLRKRVGQHPDQHEQPLLCQRTNENQKMVRNTTRQSH